jgi:diguanylate cyclase (GGDEF)-like protein
VSGADASGAGWSLRQRLKWGLVAAALLPALLFGAALLWNQWRGERDSLMLRLDANARRGAGAIDDALDARLAGVQLLAEQHGQTAVDAPPDLRSLLRASPDLRYVLFADTAGRVLALEEARGRPAPAGLAVAGTPWFARARDLRGPLVSGAQVPLLGGKGAEVALAAPVLRDGRSVAVVEAGLPVEGILGPMGDNFARRGFLLLLLDRGNRVVSSRPELRWRPLESTGATGQALRAVATTVTTRAVPTMRDDLLRSGEPAFVATVALRNGWVLALAAPRGKLLAPLLPRLWLLAALIGGSVLGVVWAVWRQKRLLRDNIGYLLASLKGYALGGRIDEGVVPRLPDELKPLAAGIGDLGSRRNDAFLELRQVLDEREYVIAERTDSLRRAVADLDRLSRTDALTGSLNYRGFQEAGESLWGQARALGKPLSVLALDIDHFKRYNDLYGHIEGDGALRRFAGAVRSALQHADDVVARPGGEEFIVFLPGSTLEQAMRVAERVCQRVRGADIVHAGSPKGRMTVSIGVAALDPTDRELEQMLLRADEALYRAKKAGRDQASL